MSKEFEVMATCTAAVLIAAFCFGCVAYCHHASYSADVVKARVILEQQAAKEARQ
jgi:hypothetical protein